jgi:endoglucanase
MMRTSKDIHLKLCQTNRERILVNFPLNKNRNISKWLNPCLSFIALILVLFNPARLYATPTFPLHTSGAYIVDANGTRVRFNAFNWYGAESTDYVVGGLQKATLTSIVQTIKGLGFNAVRIPWSNEMYESNPVVADYALAANTSLKGEKALTILDTVIAELTNEGIMVILDNHNSNAEWCCSSTDGNTLWYNDAYPESSWLSDWEGMAARYKDNSLVIGADLRNEPRATATWGGDSTTDWQAAAVRGGNAVLGVNPNLLIFVEGINYSLDLSGVETLPVTLDVSNQLVYEAHDYSYDYSSLSNYSNYVSSVDTRWGYLVSGSDPKPLWVGEFGTCNTATTCVSSTSSSDNGYWYGFLNTYLQQYSLDWGYWAINGTETTGSERTFGATETYGVLNTTWDGSALSALTSSLTTMMSATPSFTFANNGSITLSAAGKSGSTTVSIIPLNGFTGAITLSCIVSSRTGSGVLPTCTLPASATISDTSAVKVSVTVNTTSTSSSQNRRRKMPWQETAGTVMAGLFLLYIPVKHRHILASMMLLVAVSLGVSGCDNSSSSSSSSSSNSTGTGTYIVTLTGSTSSATTQKTTVKVVVD